MLGRVAQELGMKDVIGACVDISVYAETHWLEYG